MVLQLSPKYNLYSFSWPYSLDDKILIFEDQIFGWTLDIAEQMMVGRKGEKGQVISKAIQGSEQAALGVVLGYFEMIGKCLPGQNKTSTDAFNNGLRNVFKASENIDKAYSERGQVGKDHMEAFFKDLKNILYNLARCGLYHSIQLDIRLVFNSLESELFTYHHNKIQNVTTDEVMGKEIVTSSYGQISLNIVSLIAHLKRHFAEYIEKIKNPNETDLRQRFENWYNLQNQNLLKSPKPPKFIDINPIITTTEPN